MSTARKLDSEAKITIHSEFPQMFENALLEHFAGKHGAKLGAVC